MEVKKKSCVPLSGLRRWHQRDPIGYVDGASLYEYCRADPFGGIDQLGAMYITPDTVIRTGAPAAPFVVELGGASGIAVGAGEGALVAGSFYAGWWAGNQLVEHTSIENHVGYAIYAHNSNPFDGINYTDEVLLHVSIVPYCARMGHRIVCTMAYTMARPVVYVWGLFYPAVRGDLPVRGKPNSSQSRDDGKGHGQIRDYGKDGRAKTDYDFGHDHTGKGDPHAHDWNWTDPNNPVRCPPRSLQPGE